jgi:hypothetical protein
MKVGSPRAKASKKKGPCPSPEFLKGQVWKTDGGYVVISDVGKMLVHYRLGSRPEIRTYLARITTKEEVHAYLERNGGVLFTKQE